MTASGGAAKTGGRTARGYRRPGPDSVQQHRDWLALIETTGPFLSLPVLRSTWPTLDALDRPVRDRLRSEHAAWQADVAAGQGGWIEYVLRDLLGWGDELVTGPTATSAALDAPDPLDALALDVPEYDRRLVPSFALVEPGEDVKPATTRLIGVVLEPGQQPTVRVPGETWAATPVDRMAQLCRSTGVELGLVTDGRWWALVWAPVKKATTTAVFDAVAWAETAERDVVRAFLSILCRRRFFGVPEAQRLPALLVASEGAAEDITEALGVQVREAVELLVTAIGRADTEQRGRGDAGLADVDAHEIYRGAVSVMMRVVFLLFAEERGLLPSDNELYATAYSAGRLCKELERRAQEGSEDELESTYVGWHRLLALFQAVHGGVAHPRLRMHPHDGSLFDPDVHRWLPLHIDDRTVLHMLRAVQYVEIGTGRSRERRALSFGSLDVEQIGYVYEGLLSYDGFRADDVVVGLVGKRGLEDEVRLRDLETLAGGYADLPSLAAAIAAAYKDSGIGSARAVEKKLAPLAGTEREAARKKLLAAVRGDYPLSERLLTFYGLIRTDLRDLPVVVMPGELYVTESRLRKNTGTHYTPRDLAEEVVLHALEPLVYSPGPLQTADAGEWKLKRAEEILALKVADIAMGSAAFLVAAARYLGRKLIEAWAETGDERTRNWRAPDDGLGEDSDPLVIEARREIIEHCLYGVDINPMAVEMAKLSLWLVSMDPVRPFTFLDDRLVDGDSLLGIASVKQLHYMHLDIEKGEKLHKRLDPQLLANVRAAIANVSSVRRELATVDGSTVAGLARKRELLAETDEMTARAELLADLAVGATLRNSRRGEQGLADGSILAADWARKAGSDDSEARAVAREWLAHDLPPDAFPRKTLHWPLAFPEVIEGGRGFDAVVGNPPFLGGKKISGPLGAAYREYLVSTLAGGTKGNADLVAYFVLRAHELLGSAGQAGLIATNTLAQGDTREVGLDRLIASGVTIRRSVKSAAWPSHSAALEYCAVWTSRAAVPRAIPRIADGSPVGGIAPSLDLVSRAGGQDRRLIVNRSRCFQGSNVVGIGFTVARENADAILGLDVKNKDVIFPYLNGEDLNSRPDCSAARLIINFGDRSLEEVRVYGGSLDHVRRFVKPQRDQLPDYKRRVRDNWWKYEHQARPLYEAISELRQAVAITLHAKTVMPVMVPTCQVFSHALAVFATDDTAMLALLSSAPHYWWAKLRGSTLGTGIRYTPTDVFETFAMPELTEDLRRLGDELDTYRRGVMLGRQLGLTKTYNKVFDPTCNDADINELRRIHREIDEATIAAYGWEDRIAKVGGLDHGFHPVGRETRYTVGPAAQREILDSLLELNHERYAEEVAQGLHDKKAKGRKPKQETMAVEGGLFSGGE